MADDNKIEQSRGKLKAVQDPGLSATTSAAGFKLNAQAPEFFPGSSTQAPFSGYFYPYPQFLADGDGGMGSEWIFVPDQDQMPFSPGSGRDDPTQCKITNDVIQKILKQVEFQFSDANLIASDFLLKIMNKDPEGYVPMSVIASWKKIKSLGVNNQMLIKALRTSSKLVVSEDGKKVRRNKLFTEKDKEELMSRTVVVENLPEDSSRQNIEKIFSTIGSVKNIRICHPQESSSNKSSKTDLMLSKKLHAFVEFEATDQAEKAVEKLNDERNWRKGLRVRTMVRRTPRSVIRVKRSEYDQFDLLNSEDERSPISQDSESPKMEQVIEHNAGENQNDLKRTWGRLRAKIYGPPQNYNGRGILSQTPQGAQPIGHGVCENYVKPSSIGPRNPDGTRGFTMGRGKPLTPSMATVNLAPIKL
ncbi:hypothetical protein KSP39_PZI001986 [Platanthera zijinensis]|uniref:La-related protein 6C-like n=1 Tax=Platanthera zijinensis TaxID=2320716 RepID=A0AAP0GEE5_9ASPA